MSTDTSRIIVALSRALDESDIDQLRLAAYAGASYFDLKDTSYLRVANDPVGSQTLCAWAEDKLVATVRMTPVYTTEQANEQLGFAAPRALDLPAVVLSRGAVSSDYQGQGWMPFLIALSVELANQHGFRSALGAQARGTPHQAAMLRAGWQVQDVGPMSHAALDMRTTGQFLWLQAEDFDVAVRHGLEKGARLMARCSPRGLRELLGKDWTGVPRQEVASV